MERVKKIPEKNKTDLCTYRWKACTCKFVQKKTMQTIVSSN